MIQSFDISDLLPWHGHVFQEFHYCVRHVFQSSEKSRKANDDPLFAVALTGIQLTLGTHVCHVCIFGCSCLHGLG
jgi:hypothetical protein